MTPQTLKPAVTEALCELLEPVQKEYIASQEWKDVEQKAYPPTEVKKKVKREKNLGTRFPGAKKDVEAKPDGHVEGVSSNEVSLAKDASEAMQKLEITANGST